MGYSRNFFVYIACSQGTDQGNTGYAIHREYIEESDPSNALTIGRHRIEHDGWRKVIADKVFEEQGRVEH